MKVSTPAMGRVPNLDEIVARFFEGVRQTGIALETRGVVAVQTRHLAARLGIVQNQDGVEGGTEASAQNLEGQPLIGLHADFEEVADLGIGAPDDDTGNRNHLSRDLVAIGVDFQHLGQRIDAEESGVGNTVLRGDS